MYIFFLYLQADLALVPELGQVLLEDVPVVVQRVVCPEHSKLRKTLVYINI